MKLKLKSVYTIFCVIIVLVIYTYTLPRYIINLPTIPVYNNSEADLVKEISDKRTFLDEDFFLLTDPSIVHAFLPHVEENINELSNIITDTLSTSIVLGFKYLINRPRPYQINKDINYLESKTGNTPALPAGHAYQAYYLAYVLGKRYPDKRSKFDSIAKRCDDVRVKAGIHYPSDGKFSKTLVDAVKMFLELGDI